MAPIFKAWGQASVGPADPGPALRRVLLTTNRDKRLDAWWKKAESVFVVKRPKSAFVARRVPQGQLTGRPVTLSHDDDSPVGKASLTGGGHAVRFEAPGDDWYLTSVAIHGSRYGQAEAPDEKFHVWLCDADFKAVADLPFPYRRFKRGDPKWVRLQMKPVRVPRTFIICVGFNPTATKGVSLSYDKEGSGHSLTGLPGEPGRRYDKGDWLVRVRLDKLKFARH